MRHLAFVALALLTACRGPEGSDSRRSALARSTASTPAPKLASSSPEAALPPEGRAPALAAPCDLSAFASITGEIKDERGQPLCGVTLVTETEGSWSQRYLPREATFVGPYERPGTFHITASRPGYHPAVVDVQVTRERCHVQTRAVRLTLRHVAGAPLAPPCKDFASMLATAAGALPGPGPYDNLPESPIPFVTGVEAEGLRSSTVRRLAAQQPRYQECWEHYRPEGEVRPFFLAFTAQVLANARVLVQTPTQDDLPQVPYGLRGCIANALSSGELPPPTGSARFSLYLGFR